VLPQGIVERGDLLSALAPFVTKPKASKWDQTAPSSQPPAAAKAAGPAPGQAFTLQDLEAMSSKALRTLCAQKGVLPNGPVERGDLLKALAPIAAT
jgi:hypothetical protein